MKKNEEHEKGDATEELANANAIQPANKDRKRFMLELGSLVVAQFYMIQEARIKSYNRLRNIIFLKENGIDMCSVQDKKEIKDYAREYADDKLFDKLETIEMTNDERKYTQEIHGIILSLEKQERELTKSVSSWIRSEPVWTEYLQYVKGIGPLLTAMLLYYFGYCEKARYSSNLWKYAGIALDINGNTQKLTQGERASYNPKVKTFVWRICTSLIMHGNKFYRRVYDNEKEKQVNMLKNSLPGAPASLKNADLRARRKMAKMFLSHYYSKCKRLTNADEEQLPFVFDKLKHPMNDYIDIDDLLKSWKAEAEPAFVGGSQVTKDKIQACGRTY